MEKGRAFMACPFCYWPPRQPCSETSELVLLGQAKSTIMRSIGFICKTSAL